MLELAVLLYWVTVALYAVCTVGFLIGVFWRRDGLLVKATWLVAGTLAVHGVSIALRWAEVGHGPYINRHEVFSSDAWAGLAAFLIVQWRLPRLRPAGAAILPVALLLMGSGALATAEVEALPPSLRSMWLVVHVGFAKLAFGSILVGFGISIMYLFRQRAQQRGVEDGWTGRLPGLARMDELNYRFTGLGFACLAIMIFSGAIWAHDAWGNYWSWDAIETWSLATWLMYGVNLHLRTTFRWHGDRAAWLSVGTLAMMIIAFKGLAYVVPGAHVDYLAK